MGALSVSAIVTSHLAVGSIALQQGLISDYPALYLCKRYRHRYQHATNQLYYTSILNEQAVFSRLKQLQTPPLVTRLSGACSIFIFPIT
jgi:hypothetical protein